MFQQFNNIWKMANGVISQLFFFIFFILFYNIYGVTPDSRSVAEDVIKLQIIIDQQNARIESLQNVRNNIY